MHIMLHFSAFLQAPGGLRNVSKWKGREWGKV